MGAIDRRAGPVDDTVGAGPGDDPVGGHREGPAAFVDEVVVPFAQRQQIVDVGGSVVFPPPFHVVDAARREPDGAVGVGAGAVHRPQRPALSPVGGAFGAADVEHFAVATQHHRHDLGLAAHPPHGRHRQRHTVLGLADPVRRGARPQHASGRRARTSGAPAAAALPRRCAGDRPTISTLGRIARDDVAVEHAVAGDGLDHCVHLQLAPRCAGVAVGVAEPGGVGVDGTPQRGIAHGVELEMGVTHPGDPVDPVLDVRRLALRVEFVGIGTGV